MIIIESALERWQSWSIASDLKSDEPVRVPGVRIPPSPLHRAGTGAGTGGGHGAGGHGAGGHGGPPLQCVNWPQPVRQVPADRHSLPQSRFREPVSESNPPAGLVLARLRDVRRAGIGAGLLPPTIINLPLDRCRTSPETQYFVGCCHRQPPPQGKPADDRTKSYQKPTSVTG